MLSVSWVLLFLVPAALVAASAWHDRSSLREPGGVGVAGLTVLVIAAGLAVLIGIGEWQREGGFGSVVALTSWGAALNYTAAAAMALVRVRLASSLLLGSALAYPMLFIVVGQSLWQVDAGEVPEILIWIEMCLRHAVPAVLAGVLFRFAAWRQAAASAHAPMART